MILKNNKKFVNSYFSIDFRKICDTINKKSKEVRKNGIQDY